VARQGRRCKAATARATVSGDAAPIWSLRLTAWEGRSGPINEMKVGVASQET